MNDTANRPSVAIMQPYFFPYIGYYQLVYASRIFVFYDDVAYINRGWINRNRILANGKPAYFTVFLDGASQNRTIRDICFVDNRSKLLRTLEMAYRKAPFFAETMVPVADVLTRPVKHIADLAMASVMTIMDHLGVERLYRVSSVDFPHTKTLARGDRLIAITQECGSAHYVNPMGGSELYDKAYFEERGVILTFLDPLIEEYKQFGGLFQPGLSIIDVLMFNGRRSVIGMLSGTDEAGGVRVQ